MNKLNKLVTNYPVELTPEEVGNLSLTLSAVRTAREDDKTYTGEGFVTVNNTNNIISLTTEANEKLNQPIPTKVSDLTDSANYQTMEGMNDYLTKTSASENLAPLSVTADIESLKNVSGDFSLYYKKTETSSKEELDTTFGSKQDNLTNEQLSAISSVSSIKGTILTGDSNIRATSAEDGNNIKWTLELTAQPVVTDTTLSGYHGIVATKDSTVSSQWNVGIEQAYKEQIEAVSSKLTKESADTLYAPISVIEDVGTLKTASSEWNKVGDKLDTTAFRDVSGNFLTAHQDISNKLDTSAFSAVSATFLTEDDLNVYATKIDLETTSGKLLTTAQYKTDSATFLTAHQNLDAYATKEYANNASANALSQAKTWVENQNYLKEVPNTYATKTDLNTASSTLTGVDNELSGHIDYVSAHTITSLDNYYTKTQVDSTFASATQLNNYLTTSQYNTDSGTFALKTEIPKTVSQLTDSGNYYQKTDTSSKTEITDAFNTKVDKPSQTGKLVYDGDNNEWVTLPEGTTTIVQGQGSVTSNYDASNSTYTVSLLATAENALNKVDDKIDTTAVAQTYQTKEDMSNYLTINDASTAYQPIGDYATTSDISDMATQTWVGQQGFYTKASGDNDYAPKTITATVNTLTAASAGWNEVSSKLDASVASTTYQTKEDMNDYLTKSEASTTYQPTGNYLVSDDITGKLDKSIYENASGNWENTYNTVKQYSAAGTWLTAHQSLTNYYTKNETSSTTQLSAEFAKYVTSSDITPDIDYVMTTTGWKELTLPGGGMTQVIHDETLTGQGIDGNNLGVNTEIIQSKLTNAQLSSISSVSGKVDKPIATSAANKYLVYSTNANDSGWCELSAGGDYLPLSGGTVSGGVIVSSSGNCLLAVGTEDTLIGQSRVVNMGDTTAKGTNWLGVSQSNQGFIKYVNGGDVGALNGTSIQINFAPDGANSYGNITVNSQDNMSKVINVPTASYNSMSSFDSTNGPNYMLRKTASGFDIGAAVINVTELPQQTEANAYYFVYDT